MKLACLIMLMIIFASVCKAQDITQLPRAELLKTATKRDIYELRDDSLGVFKESLLKSIEPLIKESKGRIISQFSICVKTTETGEIDTIMASDNASNAIKYHIFKNQHQLDYTQIAVRAKLKKWYGVYILFPINVLYGDAKKLSWSTFLDAASDLPHTYSFNSLNFALGSHKIIIATPMTPVFGFIIYD